MKAPKLNQAAAVSILALGLLTGCASNSHQDEQIRQSYRTGMTREEVQAVLEPSQPMKYVSRPVGGWSDTDESNHRIGLAASQFERHRPGVSVQSCEVYWSSRNRSMSAVPCGMWQDYLFFDSHKGLLGYYRTLPQMVSTEDGISLEEADIVTVSSSCSEDGRSTLRSEDILAALGWLAGFSIDVITFKQ